MKTMYTSTPDEGCYEVSEGVYARPVRNDLAATLRKIGWRDRPADLPATDEVPADAEAAIIEAYAKRFGKNPHHKMKVETMLDQIEAAEAEEAEENDEAE